MTADDPIRESFEEASRTLTAFLDSSEAMAGVARFADAAAETLGRGGLLMSCGNGGSMCDAMHFAEEWTGRFRSDRVPLPALAFSDPSHLTCIANDFGYDEVFAREVAAYGKPGVQTRETQDALAAAHDSRQHAWFMGFLERIFAAVSR